MTAKCEHNTRRAARYSLATVASVSIAMLVTMSAPAAARDDRTWFTSSGKTATASSGTSFWGQTFDSAFASSSSGKTQGRQPTLSKKNIEPMKRAIARYKAIAKRGWKPIPLKAAKLKLQRGVKHPYVALLRARLVATGDMQTNSALSSSFDYYVEKGLVRFQKRHGLRPTGNLINKTRRSRLGTRTLVALNVSAKARLRQLQGNLQRLRSLVSKTRKGRYVVVNIPAQQVEAVEKGRVAQRHTAVVGKKDRATPLLSSRIHRVKFNPEWTLPPTVITKDLIPRGQSMQKRKQDVLQKFEINAFSGHGGRKIKSSKINWNGGAVRNYVYVQPPGPQNPLGFVKIDFHNRHSVYMHDTPSQRIFGRQDRAASSGCIRIQNIGRLVTWLLRDNNDWSGGRVASMKKSGKSQNVPLKRSVPLHFVYVTAWATNGGGVSFRPDIYNRDRRYGVKTVSAAY